MLKIDPNETVDITLACYDGEPKDTRPAFVMAFPTARKLREAYRLDDAAVERAKADDAEGYAKGLITALKVGLRGWKNVGVPYDAEFVDGTLDDLLQASEMRELLNRWYAATRVTPEEKRGFPSPSPADGAASAASAAGENVPASSPSPNPSSSATSAQPAAATP